MTRRRTQRATSLIEPLEERTLFADVFEFDRPLTEVNGKTLFDVQTETARVLYAFDGSTVTQIMELTTSLGSQVETAGTQAYFTTQQFDQFFGTFNWVLWKTDGTAAGTTQVTTLGQRTNPGDLVTDMEAVGSNLYFSTNNGTGTSQLWLTDGTQFG